MVTAITAENVRPFFAFEGVFSSGTLRLWTGVGSLSWDSQTWTGGGHLLKISPIKESSGVQAIGWEITLSGMPTDKVSLAMQNGRQGYAGSLWMGCLDATGAVIADPYLLASGFFEAFVISDDGDSCIITAKYEGRLIDLERPREWRYTDEHQQRFYPGDKGFEYVQRLQDGQFLMGGPASAASPLATPDSGNSNSDGSVGSTD
jgi:hypothetical protein